MLCGCNVLALEPLPSLCTDPLCPPEKSEKPLLRFFPSGEGVCTQATTSLLGQNRDLPLKRIWFSGSWALNSVNIFRVVSKRILVLTTLRVWRPRPHTPTKFYIECLHWMFESCQDTQRGARVVPWRRRLMVCCWLFCLLHEDLSNTREGDSRANIFFQGTWLGNWRVYYFTNLVRAKSRKSKEIEALKCFESLMFEKLLGNKDNHAIWLQRMFYVYLAGTAVYIYLFIYLLFIRLFFSHSYNKTIKRYKSC